MDNDKRFNILFFAVLAAAAAFRLVGAGFNLPHVYTTEEYKIVNYALRMGKDGLNPHFFNYPSLYIYFTFFVSGIYFVIGRIFGAFASAQDFAVSFIRNPTDIYLTMRIISGLWSTATIAMTYLIAKELSGKRAGLIAMALMALIPAILVSSHEIRPSMPSMFLIASAFYCVLIFLKKDDYRYFYFSSALTGLAISIYYTAAFLAPVIFLAHFLARKKFNIFDYRLWAGMILVPAFFIAGTPFSVLDFSSFYRDFSAHSQGALANLPKGLPVVLQHYLYIGHTIHLTPFLGLLCYAGLVAMIITLTPVKIIFISGILFFSLPAAMYFSPGIGYLFPAYPLFVSAGAFLLDKVFEKSKTVFWAVLLICLGPSLWDATDLIRTYLSEDTRTTAFNWVENNIKPDSKILIDMAAHSPPLKETKRQLERIYARAAADNNYKKDYIKLQIEAYPKDAKGYEIWRVFHKPLEVSGKADVRLVLEAQKTQDLIDISAGWNKVKRQGFDYFIYNNLDRDAANLSGNAELKNFYDEAPEKTELLARFESKSKLYPSPLIEIRKIK